MTKTKRQLRAEAVERLKTIYANIGMSDVELLDALIPGCPRNSPSTQRAVIDLLTDDESPEGDEWKAKAEHDGARRSNDAFASENGVSDGADGSNDTREALEADVRRVLTSAYMLAWQHGYENVRGSSFRGLYRDFYRLLDRQAAITERESHYRIEDLSHDCEMWRDRAEDMRMERDDCVDRAEAELKRERARNKHWQHLADLHLDEARRLRKQLETPLPEGVEWPRFEDGELVKPGDVVWEDDYAKECAGREREVYEIDFAYLLGPRCWLRDKNGGTIYAESMYEHGPAKRPPLTAADGRPIEVGQVLYGGDGRAWKAIAFDYANAPHVVVGTNERDGQRELKPGWLTHEPPDGLEAAKADMAELIDNLLLYGGKYAGDAEAEADAIVSRIEKLAKEGA